MSNTFTMAGLQHLPDTTLRKLFQRAHHEMARGDPDSPERRNALASLENISRVLNQPRP